jgi:hypothetical protein
MRPPPGYLLDAGRTDASQIAKLPQPEPAGVAPTRNTPGSQAMPISVVRTNKSGTGDRAGEQVAVHPLTDDAHEDPTAYFA